MWAPRHKRSEVRIVHQCGRADDPAVTERLRRLARRILRRCAPEEILAQAPDWRLVDAWPYGDLSVLETRWQRLGIAEVMKQQLASRRVDFPVERALFARGANRACAPSCQLDGDEQWLRADVRSAGTETLALHPLDRAMALLEAHTDVLAEALDVRLADLLHLDVALLFSDTTALHCAIEAEDWGVGEDDWVEGRQAAGAKTYKALRKRGLAKNGRGDVPQMVIGLAVRRDGFPVRHGGFPGNTVAVTTVAQVKADLRGWQLRRCGFVGDAGMVSAENLHRLSQAGGKYLLWMPMRRGDEVTPEVLRRPGR